MSAGGAAALEAIGLSSGEAADEFAWLAEVGHVRDGEGLRALDRRLGELCRQRGPLRAVVAHLSALLIVNRAWGPLGYARLNDYAVERLGLSGRFIRGFARVGKAFYGRPWLEEALASGTLGWTKVRLLAELPMDADGAAWVSLARRLTALQLSKRVRKVDFGSIEGGALEKEPRSRLFEVRCSREVRLKWYGARSAASRVAGHMLRTPEAAELIAAEVLSAIPIDEPVTDP